ncbi:MAG: UDP-2,3-diacylglucosamine diphosphatase LpxI [Pseudomonadota bacterium]|nr:UDP-2,3-diacylglucosamine diphosphatase LpxI [Pseudomonadota bacterium]
MPLKLGILAGGGDLPKRLARLCQTTGRDYFIVAFSEQADADLVVEAPHEWIALGAGGQILEALRREQVSEVVMAGHIKRPKLSELKLDAYGAKLLARIGYRMLGDNSLLSALAEALKKEGFSVRGADELETALLAPIGVLGAIVPNHAALKNITVGIKAARALGAEDLGQAVIVSGETVVARETQDGTDAMIQRVGGSSGKDGVLVKMKKPDQDRRIDLPTIGSSTVENAAAAGLSGIAVEAGATLVLDRENMVQKADTAGLFVIGVRASDWS